MGKLGLRGNNSIRIQALPGMTHGGAKRHASDALRQVAGWTPVEGSPPIEHVVLTLPKHYLHLLVAHLLGDGALSGECGVEVRDVVRYLGSRTSGLDVQAPELLTSLGVQSVILLAVRELAEAVAVMGPDLFVGTEREREVDGVTLRVVRGEEVLVGRTLVAGAIALDLGRGLPWRGIAGQVVAEVVEAVRRRLAEDAADGVDLAADPDRTVEVTSDSDAGAMVTTMNGPEMVKEG